MVRVRLCSRWAEVELLCPAGACVHHGEVVEQCRAQLVELVCAHVAPCEPAVEYAAHLAVGIVVGIEAVYAVVGQAATHAPEEVVAALEGLHERGVGVYGMAGCLLQAAYIGHVLLM